MEELQEVIWGMRKPLVMSRNGSTGLDILMMLVNGAGFAPTVQ